ncbi:MAG: methionyl-tRNA formyltransferase [Ruminococcus sp.]|nr:methionyl-tRNA formyltransferase [Ruminococcus sp.]
MARIDFTNIEKVSKERNNIHDKVYSTYTAFEKDGKEYVQLDTYGRNNRELPGKISQSIQVDKDDALVIIDILKKEFDL